MSFFDKNKINAIFEKNSQHEAEEKNAKLNAELKKQMWAKRLKEEQALLTELIDEALDDFPEVAQQAAKRPYKMKLANDLPMAFWPKVEAWRLGVVLSSRSYYFYIDKNGKTYEGNYDGYEGNYDGLLFHKCSRKEVSSKLAEEYLNSRHRTGEEPPLSRQTAKSMVEEKLLSYL